MLVLKLYVLEMGHHGSAYLFRGFAVEKELHELKREFNRGAWSSARHQPVVVRNDHAFLRATTLGGQYSIRESGMARRLVGFKKAKRLKNDSGRGANGSQHSSSVCTMLL
mmetsp:Transcript_7655/g.13410  ORF Transcript_7655/g.13410 Transcript_7655/m.13410 type:complete len:110 (+) Transcript_7655:715-1044(+)